MDNLEELDKFLEMHNLPRLNQEKIENMNKSTTRVEIKSVIFKKQYITVQDQMASQMNSTKHLGKSQQLFQTILFKLLRTLQRKYCFWKFYEDSLTLIPKTDKNITKKET